MKKNVERSGKIGAENLHGCNPSAAGIEGNCVTCPFRKKSLFRDLSVAELELLNNKRYTESFASGESIYQEGTRPKGLICLKNGKIKIVKSIDNKTELIIDLKKPVDFISVKSLMMRESYTDSAVALEDSTICVIEKDSFFKVVAQNPEFSMRLIQFFAKKLDESEKRLMNLTNKHMRARLAEALLLIYDIYGLANDGTLNVKLKRAELASLANMIPSNAIRILSEFGKENIIETNRRKITIQNMESLKELSKHGVVLK
jgi:CRP-like cAMP-binding protein